MCMNNILILYPLFFSLYVIGFIFSSSLVILIDPLYVKNPDANAVADASESVM